MRTDELPRADIVDTRPLHAVGNSPGSSQRHVRRSPNCSSSCTACDAPQLLICTALVCLARRSATLARCLRRWSSTTARMQTSGRTVSPPLRISNARPTSTRERPANAIVKHWKIAKLSLSKIKCLAGMGHKRTLAPSSTRPDPIPWRPAGHL